MSNQSSLIVTSRDRAVAVRSLASLVAAWADARTDATSERRGDLRHDKTKAVLDFFAFVGKTPEQITANDVREWQAHLEEEHKAPATVYAMLSRVSSFYNWAKVKNPVIDQVRPKAPLPYQSESSKSLSDDDVCSLMAAVKKLSRKSIAAKRDYAMLAMYFATGMRREEIARLRWGDLQINGKIVFATRVKGGQIVTRELKDPAVQAALLHYLKASRRLKSMKAESPLWTRHDRAGKPGGRLTSHAFSKNLKHYAALAGIGAIHVHMTRHTVA
ncbi:MAG: tyrosine-type recombinase/integrase, partial [Chloroflexota bacterium]|nr:tyrosine-type recombinase/integrase [Chloroflexota bacterium]